MNESFSTHAITRRLEEFAGAFDLPSLVHHAGQETSRQWAAVLPVERANRIRRLVISGCGDSLFAGVASRLAVERFGGVPCEALDALECGRYAARRFDPTTAVLGISNSGTTSRVVESLVLARRAGALTLALTGTAGSPLERSSDASVVRPVVGVEGQDRSTAGVGRHLGEYVSTLVALFHLALHLGAVRGVLTDHERQREAAKLEEAGLAAQRALADGPVRIMSVMEHLRDAQRVFYLGGGPAYGTALFGAAKLVEEVPMCGVPQHLEEWAHLQYFLTMVEGRRTRAVVVAPSGEGTDRATEITRSIGADGGIAIVVTHAHEVALREAASAAIVVEGTCAEEYAPVPYAVPMQLLGIALALAHGQSVVPLARRDRGRLIRASAVRGVVDA